MSNARTVEGRRFLSDSGVWPAPNVLDIDGWLENFDIGRDRDIAVALLGSHFHFNEDHIRHSLKSTVRSLSAEFELGPASGRAARWRSFLDGAFFSYPEGKGGDTAASGRIFMRIVKESGINENKILDPPDLIKRLDLGDPADVIFLDDLSGTGNQFCQHWSRKYTLLHGKRSLADVHEKGNLRRAYFLPISATTKAKLRVEEETPVRVFPAYLLGNEYFATDADSRIAPTISRNELELFLRKYSPRVEGQKHGVLGYADLGLALSFHHGIPNNVLPVFRRSPENSPWKSLVEK